jgi:anti-sigma factor RsiW
MDGSKLMAITKKIHRRQRVEAEALLPWYAAGTIGTRDARHLIVALARDPELAKQYAAVREEHAEMIRLNENLGVPSPRAMHNLFAAIDADEREAVGTVPARTLSHSSTFSMLRRFLLNLSPRALAWSTAMAIVALLLVGSAIGTLLTSAFQS